MVSRIRRDRRSALGAGCLAAALCAGAAWAPALCEPAIWVGLFLSDAVDGGVEVLGVVPGGPAAIAGVRAGDVVVRAGDRPLGSLEQLEAVLGSWRVGEPLRLELLREGQRLSLRVATRAVPRAPGGYRVTVPPLPPPAPSSPAAPRRHRLAGLALEPLTRELRVHFGSPDDAGLLVTRVDPGRAAARAGLRVGDLLVQLGEVRVRGIAEVDAALAPGPESTTPLTALVIRDRRPLRLELARETTRSEVADARGPATAVLARTLETEIDRLERRIEQLRRELRELREGDAERARPSDGR